MTIAQRVRACAAVMLAGIGVLAPAVLSAGGPTIIKTDSSWGRTPATLSPSATNSTVTGNTGTTYNIPGSIYKITEAQGVTKGTNLFHSFESFSVGSGDAAVFTTTTASLKNVISRVSGSSPSNIEGLLALVPAPGSAPNFFFINPAGVAFGAGAQIDVPAAFHVSTANYLRLGDTVFSAGTGPDSTLAIAAPTAFGFLGTTRASVTVADGAVLATSPGGALSVVAGDVRIAGGTLLTQGGGDVRIAAVGADTIEIPLIGALPALHGTVEVVNGGAIVATSMDSRDGGNIAVGAGDIVIDGQGSGASFTGISSVVLPDSTGNGGTVSIAAAHNLSLLNGALISSETYSSGNGGDVSVIAASMMLDAEGNSLAVNSVGVGVQTGIMACVCAIDSGARAGGLSVITAGQLSILNGAQILSTTFGTTKSGPVRVSASNMTIDEQASEDFTGVDSETRGSGAGADIDASIAGQLSIVNGAQIVAGTRSGGDAGSVSVHAGSIYIDEQTSPFATGIASTTAAGSSGNSGSVHISVDGALSIVNGGGIDSDTSGAGAAGSIEVKAATLSIDARGNSTFAGISSDADDGIGRAGAIQVVVDGEVSILNGGAISSTTVTKGAAGSIKLTAGKLTLDTQGSQFFTGIFSETIDGASGNAGSLDVVVSGKLVVLDGAQIATSSFDSAGNAGSTKVSAGSIAIDGRNNQIFNTGILAAAGPGSSGRGGEVIVSAAGGLSVVSGGLIASSTNSSKDAGTVSVRASNITIDNAGSNILTGIATSTTDAGNGGSLSVSATDTLLVLDAGLIGASSVGTGNAGSIKISADQIIVDARDNIHGHGIQATSGGASSGDAGNIDVSARQLSLIRGGYISVSTFSSVGHAGAIAVNASSLLVDGSLSHIDARARAGSSGQTGNITINADNTIMLSNGGSVSIRNDATVADPGTLLPTLLSVSAPQIALVNGGQINAESTGNIPASDIRVHFTDRLRLDPSSITTSAVQGNGGAIRIEGGNVVVLDNSQITTSVSGSSGNGGDIAIHAGSLVMRTGFIQANTAGVGATGGNVSIDVQSLVPSGSTVAIGGAIPAVFQPGVFGVNVIQAAAPSGVSGAVQVTTPALDISGSLKSLYADLLAPPVLARNLCRTGAGSSLTTVGRGGLRPRASALIRPDIPVAAAPSAQDRSAERYRPDRVTVSSDDGIE